MKFFRLLTQIIVSVALGAAFAFIAINCMDFISQSNTEKINPTLRFISHWFLQAAWIFYGMRKIGFLPVEILFPKSYRYLVCDHKEIKFVRNVYGDEINFLSTGKKTYRSIWQCTKCKGCVPQEKLVF